jgi:adenine-specific DNA-methyltransferase
MGRNKPGKSSTDIASIKHADKRRNIPTEELRDFVADDEKRPKTVLYPRDPSLDPQLVWQGKDEQDSRNPGCRLSTTTAALGDGRFGRSPTCGMPKTV